MFAVTVSKCVHLPPPEHLGLCVAHQFHLTLAQPRDLGPWGIVAHDAAAHVDDSYEAHAGVGLEAICSQTLVDSVQQAEVA